MFEIFLFFIYMSITFIIPTIGRESLIKTIDSIYNQTIEDWKAIIIFDGIDNKFEFNDPRIEILEIQKKGKGVNSAGEVRNEGMNYVDTEWISFVDDDDTLACDYIESFYETLEKYPFMDCLIFRMFDKFYHRIIPKIDVNDFHLCDVGISFIYKRSLFEKGLKFVADGAEDFLLLDLIRKNNYSIILSKYVKYFIKSDPYILPSAKEDIFINKINHTLTLVGYLSLVLTSS